MSDNPVYFDNCATTALCAASLSAYESAARAAGNPSSLHALGAAAQNLLEAARGDIAKALRCESKQIIFTSGGTESNNLALLGAAAARRRLGNRIVSTAAEHASVYETLRALESQGFEVIFLSPNNSGEFSKEEIEQAVTPDTILISVTHTCNETGAYSPLSLFSRAADNAAKSAKKRPLLHCDAVQAFGKESLDPGKLGIDLLSISAHKVFGPKGIGALYTAAPSLIKPVFFGGGQERGLRPGTEPVEAACAFAAAVRNFGNLQENRQRVTSVREKILSELETLSRSYRLPVHSPPGGSPYILNFSADSVRSETMLHYLESRGIYVSSGSACARGKPSRVLAAMGVSHKTADSALRLSFSKHSTTAQAELFLRALREGLEKLARPRA